MMGGGETSDADDAMVESFAASCIKEGWYICHGVNTVEYGTFNDAGQCLCCDGFGWYYNDINPSACPPYGWCCAYCGGGGGGGRSSLAVASTPLGSALLL